MGPGWVDGEGREHRMAQASQSTRVAPGAQVAQTTQRLEAAKTQITRQGEVIARTQQALASLDGERRVLDLREQRLRDQVTAAEQALTAAQERVRHTQAAALIEATDAADTMEAGAALTNAQGAAQVAHEALAAALGPTGAIGAARADLEVRRAELLHQSGDAKAMLQALERHAHDAHVASGQAHIDELGAAYDVAIARLQSAYAEAQAAREQLATIANRTGDLFGTRGRAGGAWQASAISNSAAAQASASVLSALEQRIPVKLGRAADIVGAFDALMAALEQGAGRVPAQIGSHPLRAVMQLDHSYFAQHWVFALLESDSPTARKPFEIMREQARGLLAATWAQAQPSPERAGDDPQAS